MPPTQQSQSEAVLPQNVQKLMQNLGPMVNTPYGRRFTYLPGTVVKFNYQFFHRDPQPLVLIAFDNTEKGFLHGINMHYMDVHKAYQLLFQQHNCNNRAFNYSLIKNDVYIAKAYRTYRWNGVQRVIFEDCQALEVVMNPEFRRLDWWQLEAMRKSIEQQAQEPPTNPPAVPTGEQKF